MWLRPVHVLALMPVIGAAAGLRASSQNADPVYVVGMSVAAAWMVLMFYLMASVAWPHRVGTSRPVERTAAT